MSHAGDTHFVQFMMDFELKLEKPNVSRAWVSAATMGISYFIGMSLLETMSKSPLTLWQAAYFP